jgi:hypothetical protein
VHALPVVDPEELPELYCLQLDGDCLEPVIPDRAAVMFKKSEPFDVGDVVAIWFRAEAVPAGAPRSWLKRITMNAPPGVKFPYKDHPESCVQALIMVEQLNPQIGAARCSSIGPLLPRKEPYACPVTSFLTVIRHDLGDPLVVIARVSNSRR